MKQATTGSPKGLALLLERVFGLARPAPIRAPNLLPG